jgi:hypothetical protein
MLGGIVLAWHGPPYRAEVQMRRVGLSAAVVACFLIGASTPAQAAPITYARWFAPSDLSADEAQTTDGPTMVDLGTVDVFADFGVNRVSVTAKESSAYAAWWDEWTITGGSGSGTLSVEWALEGTLSVTDTLACPSCDSSTISFTSLFGAASVLSGSPVYSASQTGTGTTVVDQSGTLLVPFTFDTQFRAGFGLGGFVGDDLAAGSVNFFNSLIVTAVVLPAGASLLTTNTRVDYPVQVASDGQVPEPGTLLLVGTGIAAAMRRRRMRTRD